MSDITLRQLKIFSLVVEQKSFTKCAEFLGVSPAAISTHIKRLEQQLGHSLFKRNPGEAALLTQDGERDYQHISTMLEEHAALLSETEQLESKVESRKLNIAIDSFIYYQMKKNIIKVQDTYPDLDICFELEAVSMTDIEKQLNQKDIDLGYFYTLGSTFSSDSKFICYEPLAIYVGEDHPLAKQDVVSVSDLVVLDAIELSDNHYLRKLGTEALAEIGLIGYNVSLRSNSFGLTLSHIQQNLGFVCMFQRVENVVGLTSGLKQLTLEQPLPSLQLRQIIHPSLKNDPFIKEVTLQLTSLLRTS